MSSQSANEPMSLFSKKSKVSSQPEPKILSQPQPDMFYNGLGGHSKDDEFPRSSSGTGFKLSKKPKGVSRPKVDQKMKTINKYFNFDTP